MVLIPARLHINIIVLFFKSPDKSRKHANLSGVGSTCVAAS
jgi:hypothetical protein